MDTTTNLFGALGGLGGIIAAILSFLFVFQWGGLRWLY
jgi:hypothetical protein